MSSSRLSRSSAVPRRFGAAVALGLLASLWGTASVSAQPPATGSVRPPPDEDEEAAATKPEKSTAPVPPPSAGEKAILAIDVEGLRRVERETALLGTRTKVGSAFDPEAITDDLRTLWRTGFFRDVQIHKDESERGIRLIIRVQEKPSIRQVLYSGRNSLSEDDIKGVVDVQAYTILSIDALKRNVGKIKDLYVEKGFYLAEVEHRVVAVVPGSPLGEIPPKGAAQARADGPEVSEVDVIFDIVEGQKVMVRQISLIGNKALADEEIKGVLQTREGSELSFLSQAGTYKQEFFQTDLLRMQALYYDHGFVAVKVGEPSATISRDRRFIYLSVPIEEGQKYDIGTIVFSGEVLLKDEAGEVLVDEQKLRERLQIGEGETFSRTKLFDDIQRLTRAYRDHGYAYANVTPNSAIREDDKKVNLDLEVERGELVYIERIEVVGNSRTRDKVIRRELRINEGDRYSESAVEESRARVFQLGYFETVNINSGRGSAPDKMNLTIEIKEKSTGTFQVGAGFSSVESFIATAQVSQNNMLGTGQLLSLSAQLSFGDFARQLATLQFYEPYLFDSRWSLGFNAYATQRFYQDFQRNATGFSPSLGYPLTDDLRLTLGYTLEWIDVESDARAGASTAALYCLNCDGRNSAVNASLSFDTRDNRLFPTAGMYHVLSGEVSSPTYTGSDDKVGYNRLQLFGRFYYPLPLSIVAKLNASFGYVFTGTEDRVPISERFFPGGIFSVRGFEPRELGPTVKTLTAGDPTSFSRDFVIGGNKEMVFNLELEFPILEMAGIKGVLFFDAGNAYSEEQNYFYADTPSRQQPPAFLIGSGREIKPPLGLYYSFGWGFRWFSPIGPLRFEWGVPITKKRKQADDIVFEFTIGNFF